MRYLAMILLSTAALGMNPEYRIGRNPADYGPARWEYGRLSSGGRPGWFLARHTEDGQSLVFAVDQPSGRKEPSYTHYRAPDEPAPSGLLAGAVNAATNGVLVGQMTGLAGHGPLLVTDGSEASDVEARKVMEEVAERPCPPSGPCPSRPDPEPDDEPEAPALDQYRRYFVPAALFAVGCLFAHRVRQIRKGS